MTRELLAAQSGWGKSWTAQARVEDHATDFEYVVLMDYKDEYRGLADAGPFRWCVGDGRLAGASPDTWAQFVADNPLLVVARDVTPEQWQQMVASVAVAVQQLPGDALVVVDEAHFVAPQGSKYPDPITSLATTGRGNGVASMWISQRLQELDETPISQADARILGGFESDRDRSKVAGYIPYNVAVHEPGAREDSLQRFKDPDGGLSGSEWMYSNTDGEQRRVDTRDWDMDAPHYGGEAPELRPPE